MIQAKEIFLKEKSRRSPVFSFWIDIFSHTDYSLLTFHPSRNKRKYNTTLKALIPLPTVEEPGPTLRPGMAAYALYPDTSCFYRATVASGPIQSSDGKRYRLQFDDDNEEVRSVKWDLIVEVPHRTL